MTNKKQKQSKIKDLLLAFLLLPTVERIIDNCKKNTVYDLLLEIKNIVTWILLLISVTFLLVCYITFVLLSGGFK